MKASQLRSRLTLQRLQHPPDSDVDYMDQKPNWVSLGSARAKLESKGGIERLDVAQMSSLHDFLVTIRYKPGITAGDRLFDREGDRYFSIAGVANLSKDLKTEGRHWTQMRVTTWPAHLPTS